MDRRSNWNRSNVISKLYGLYDAKSIIIFRYNISWLVDGCIFENGPITEQFIWDKGVNQLVTMASFDHFVQILLIQIVLITVFLELHFMYSKSQIWQRGIILCIFHGWSICLYGFFHSVFHCSL